MSSPQPPPLPDTISQMPHLEVVRYHNRWVALRISQVPEESRSRWGEDDDQIIAVCPDNDPSWRLVSV